MTTRLLGKSTAGAAVLSAAVLISRCRIIAGSPSSNHHGHGWLRAPLEDLEDPVELSGNFLAPAGQDPASQSAGATIRPMVWPRSWGGAITPSSTNDTTWGFPQADP